MSLLEQDTIRKKWVDENIRQIDFYIGNHDNEEYKVKAIRDSVIYAKQSKSGHLPELYYLVFSKSYLEEENIQELSSTVQHFRKLISSFYKNYPDKPLTISKAINTTLPMPRPTIKLTTTAKLIK